jgi:serine/threonine-protein kinase
MSPPFSPRAHRININPGLTIDGRFVVEVHLATGATGEVYSVRQPSLERRATIKVLRHSGRGARHRFIDEARVAAEIVHGNVIEIYHLGVFANGRPYYVMEFLGGERLSRRVARAALTLDEMFLMAEQVGAAIEAVHEKGYVHRNLRPSNVISTDRSNRRVKLVGFGLATSAVGTSWLTPLGAAMGSSEWMSPEQYLGHTVDARSDIYSFGLMLYASLSQWHPAAGDAPEATRANVLPDVLSLDRLPNGAQCPKELSLLLARCLARRPSERPHTMNDVLEGLELVAAEHFGATTRAHEAPTLPHRSMPDVPLVAAHG